MLNVYSCRLKFGDTEKKFEDAEDRDGSPSLYGSSIMERSLRGAAVSPVDRQKYTIHSRKSGEKRRCINKTAVFARARASVA